MCLNSALRIQSEILLGYGERQLFPDKKHHGKYNAECLGTDGRNRCACCIQAEPCNQHQVSDDIYDACDEDEEKRRFAVTESTEDCGQQVISHDKKDTAATDADIGCRQLNSFLMCLHKYRNRMCEADHHYKKSDRYKREHDCRAANDLSNLLRMFFTEILCNFTFVIL